MFINETVYPKMLTHHGFKIWLRTDAMRGYICEFDAYTSKNIQGVKRSCCFRLSVTLKFIDNHFHHVPIHVGQ